MEILIVTGPPSSGKGTQSEILSKETNFKHISIDDRCRLEEENRTEIGKIISDYQENGKLVPDSVMKDIFDQVIKENKSEAGIILDGFPKTIDQIKGLIKSIGLKRQKISNIINLEVNKEELLKRVVNSSSNTSNETEDRDQIMQLKRIEEFEEYTKPAIHYLKYKFNVLTIDGAGDVNEIAKNIKESVRMSGHTNNPS
ncbi:MAG: nucleoside monophosphate kinase [Bacteroidota bacterium]